jgi:uncharacterized iron-regulated protein
MKMKGKLFGCALAVFFAVNALAQNEGAFIIYTSKGKKVSYKKMQKKALEHQFVFFGEYHDNPIAHWLELELLRDLYENHGSSLKMGFEMFEQDQQMLLIDYIDGKISDQQFEDSCRLWPNYETDYKPLLLYAKQNRITCIASNVPRKYASLLFKRGRSALDSLSAQEKLYIVPLDFPIDTTLSQYAPLKEMDQHMDGGNLLEAQALKDATMAYFIAKNFNSGDYFYHINGAYHSNFYQGILWYLNREKPGTTVLTISTVTQENIGKLEKEYLGSADFIICVPESMTRTH